MEQKANQLAERLLDYGVSVYRLTRKLEGTLSGKHVAGQLFRSSTSAGANYEEACGAESRADFIHKLQIVLKELRESSFWLWLIKKAEMVSDSHVDSVIEEAKRLINIIAKSVITAKKKR